ncbi:MAG: helix-turn-helix domain-containing protein [Bacteroidales bacterium]|nr:helix-turn-helix domain-containing protein [Bacteroidales bacterium]
MELLTVREVARRLKRAEFTVRTWLREGKLKGTKIGNKDWRIREDDLNAYLNVHFNRKKGCNHESARIDGKKFRNRGDVI